MGKDRDDSDAALLAAAGRDDGAAFAVFYRRHLPAVVAFLMRETGDREVSADLAAEVFAAVLIASRRYRPEHASALPWLLGIARNKLLVSRRRGRIEDRARVRLKLTAVELDDGDLDHIERLAGSAAGTISALVDALPPDERHAIRSRVLDERSYPEIAAELQCSELVIRKRVSRGLARLRRELQEER